MKPVVISGTGLFTPPNSISNEELVTAFNAYAELFNAEHADAIAAGDVTALEASSSGFIEKASGIKSRYVMEKAGILDPDPHDAAHPRARRRGTVAAGRDLRRRRARGAGPRQAAPPADIDMVLVAASNMQRAYPGHGGRGAGSARHRRLRLRHERGLLVRHLRASRPPPAAVQTGQARAVLVLNPEITSGHLNFRDRDSHFIFGDACTAMVIEAADTAVERAPVRDPRFEAEDQVLEQHPQQLRLHEPLRRSRRRPARQTVPPAGPQGVQGSLPDGRRDDPRHRRRRPACSSSDIKRFWLHQANLNMNQLIVRMLLGRDADAERSAGDPRHLRQHLVGRLDHRLPQVPGRSAERRAGRDLLVRRRLFDRLRGGAQEVIDEAAGQHRAFPDRALGVQLGRQRRPADLVEARPACVRLRPASAPPGCPAPRR